MARHPVNDLLNVRKEPNGMRQSESIHHKPQRIIVTENMSCLIKQSHETVIS